MSRIATKLTEVFKFGELSDKAKQRAVQDYSEHGMCHEWWDSVEEDAKTCFAFAGIRIDKLYFSGFSSQGDGACFEGLWQADEVKPGKLKEHVPEEVDVGLHRIVRRFEEIARAFPGAYFKVKHRGYYYHKYETEFDVGFGEDDPIETLTYDSPEWKARNVVLLQAETELVELARDAMEWIYRQLQKEYEYETSEEQVAEVAEANGWEFTESGRLYR